MVLTIPDKCIESFKVLYPELFDDIRYQSLDQLIESGQTFLYNGN